MLNELGSGVGANARAYSMSLSTVRQLSDDWHYAVSMADHTSNAIFPEPWVHGGEVGGYEFVPITSPPSLFLEGRVMHNCVASYVERIVDRQLYVYSVREDGKPVATLAVAAELRDGASFKPRISQIAGPCNASVPREMERAARRWLSRGPFALPDRKAQPNDANPSFVGVVESLAMAGGQVMSVGNLDEDDEIPF